MQSFALLFCFDDEECSALQKARALLECSNEMAQQEDLQGGPGTVSRFISLIEGGMQTSQRKDVSALLSPDVPSS